MRNWKRASLRILLCPLAATAAWSEPNPPVGMSIPPPVEMSIPVHQAFPLCKEYTTVRDSKKCTFRDFRYLPDDSAFMLTIESWRDQYFTRFGVDKSLIDRYRVEVEDGQFVYRDGDRRVTIDKLLRPGQSCGGPGHEETLFVMYEDGVIVAVPVNGRTVLYFKSMDANAYPNCTTFTTHASIAFAYKYHTDPDAYASDLEDERKGLLSYVHIITAGSIKYSPDWKTVLKINSCSGHFLPSLRDFVSFLIHLDEVYPSLHLISPDELPKMIADVDIYRNNAQDMTRRQVQALLHSRLHIDMAEDDRKWNEKGGACFRYPVPPRHES